METEIKKSLKIWIEDNMELLAVQFYDIIKKEAQEERDNDFIKILDSFECNEYKNPLERAKLPEDVSNYVREQLSLIDEIKSKLKDLDK